jgi:hypothetical protein
MKVFTDKLETSFFKTDNYIKGIHEIEIISIEDFVSRYSLDPMILIGAKAWMVTRFDELVAGNPSLDGSDEPELHGEWLDIDFINEIKLLDILHAITKLIVLDSMFFLHLKESGVFHEISESWMNDEDQAWTFTAWKDARELCIILHGSGELTCHFDTKKAA